MGTDISDGRELEIAMVLLLAIAGAIGFAVYKDATRFESRYGKGPWSAPALVWGLVGFAFGLFGALFYFIATKTTKKDAYRNTVWSSQDYFDTNRYAAPPQPYAPQPQPYAAPAPAPPAQWGPPPAPAAPSAPPPGQWAPPGAPPAPPGPPPAPNVGGSDFLPRR